MHCSYLEDIVWTKDLARNGASFDSARLEPWAPKNTLYTLYFSFILHIWPFFLRIVRNFLKWRRRRNVFKIWLWNTKFGAQTAAKFRRNRKIKSAWFLNKIYCESPKLRRKILPAFQGKIPRWYLNICNFLIALELKAFDYILEWFLWVNWSYIFVFLCSR